jgi:aminopeptidase N
LESYEIPFDREIYQATETTYHDLIHTRLEVDFDWSLSRMNGFASITAQPHFYTTDSILLDAKGMDILSVKLKDQPLSYSYDSMQLCIKLDRPYTKEERFTVDIKYIAKPDERVTGGSEAITSDKGLYFINPKGEDPNRMPQIWTQGETESSSVWFPTIDAPNVKTTQEVLMTVDNKYVTLCNGKLINSTVHNNGTRTDHWKQDLPHAPYLFMMGVGEFKIVKDTYKTKNGKDMEVNYYVEPEWEEFAKAIFGETPAMIRFFSEKLGVEYPWDKYSQIVVRDYVSGAMENTGAVVFGDYVYKTNRELLDENDQRVIAHELFHHWFGDLVTCESWSNLPLNESFANYSEYLWDEFRYGVDEADYNAINEADGYFQSTIMDGGHDLIWFDYSDKEQMFDAHSYNKGGRILHMLRNHLGDEAFFQGLGKYLSDNKFKAVEFHQLRLAFEEVSGQDLNWFFNQWFLATGHPELGVKVSTSPENLVTIETKQKQDLNISPVYRLPLQIVVFDDSGKHIHDVVIDEVMEQFELPYTGKLHNVIFDYQQMLLAKVTEQKPTEMYVHQFYHGGRYNARYQGLMKGTSDRSAVSSSVILDALNDPFWNIRLKAVERIGRVSEESRKDAVEKLVLLSKQDPHAAVRSAALSNLYHILEAQESIALYEERLQNDASYTVMTTALKNLAKLDPKKAMVVTRTFENEKSSKLLSGIGQLYGQFGDSSALPFFVKTLSGSVVQDFDQVGLTNSFTAYLSKQKTNVLREGLTVFEHLKKAGGYYTKMFLNEYIEYLLEVCDERLKANKEVMGAHEKNKESALLEAAKIEENLLFECKKNLQFLMDR